LWYSRPLFSSESTGITISCQFFYQRKPLLAKGSCIGQEISGEKDLEIRIPGLSLQPAFKKRGSSLQDSITTGNKNFLVFGKKNLVVITTIISSPPVQQNGCSLKKKRGRKKQNFE
jgi:hypothetical protein